MRKTIKIKFGRLPIGAEFWEEKDECGYTFRFPLTEIEPEIVNGDQVTAKAGAARLWFGDDELVEIDQN